MAVTITSQRQISPGVWRLTWASDVPGATFRVYQDGILVMETALTEGTFTVPPGESLIVEILDDPAQRPVSAFPGRITLEWYAVPDAAGYRVEKLIGGLWAQQAYIRAAGWYHRWTSQQLADTTTHQFRVVPVGTNGNDGTPLQWSVFMVRHPDPPAVQMTYDPATGQVAIT